MKNLGLLGGLLLAAVDTEGRPGLRWRAGHAIDDATRGRYAVPCRHATRGDADRGEVRDDGASAAGVT